MKPAPLTDFERVAGGRIRADEAGFLFVPTRRLAFWIYPTVLASATLVAWFVRLSAAPPSALSSGKLDFVILGVCGALILLMWMRGTPTVSLAWSRMPLSSPLSVRKVEGPGYREQTTYAAEWGRVTVGPTTRRALFEIRHGQFRALVLVIGERAVCLSLAPILNLGEGVSLVRTLVRALDLTPERVFVGVDGAIKRVVESGAMRFDDHEDQEGRELDGYGFLAAFLGSYAWLVAAGYFALRHTSPVLTHFGPATGSCALTLVFVTPPIAFFVAVVRWISAPLLNRKAERLVASTPD